MRYRQSPQLKCKVLLGNNNATIAEILLSYLTKRGRCLICRCRPLIPFLLLPYHLMTAETKATRSRICIIVAIARRRSSRRSLASFYPAPSRAEGSWSSPFPTSRRLELSSCSFLHSLCVSLFLLQLHACCPCPSQSRVRNQCLWRYFVCAHRRTLEPDH